MKHLHFACVAWWNLSPKTYTRCWDCQASHPRSPSTRLFFLLLFLVPAFMPWMDSFSQDVVCLLQGYAIKRDMGLMLHYFQRLPVKRWSVFFPHSLQMFLLCIHILDGNRAPEKPEALSIERYPPFSRDIFRVLVNMDFHRSMGIPKKTPFVEPPMFGYDFKWAVRTLTGGHSDLWAIKLHLHDEHGEVFFLSQDSIPLISNFEDETKNWCTCTCAFVHLEWFSIHFSTYLTFQVLPGDVFQKALPIIGINYSNT